jgi:hypothetical protein
VAKNGSRFLGQSLYQTWMDAVFSAHWVYGLSMTHQEDKKSANFHQAAECSLDIFRSEDRSPHIDPLWVKAPCRLQRQVAGFGSPNRSRCLQKPAHCQKLKSELAAILCNGALPMRPELFDLFFVGVGVGFRNISSKIFLFFSISLGWRRIR